MLEIRYFAWLRERLGKDRETVETHAETVADLIDELRNLSDAHAHVFADLTGIRAARDQDVVGVEARIAGAREIAFFPPMTGG